MSLPRRRRSTYLFAAAVALFALLAVLPATGWLVRCESGFLFAPPSWNASGRDQREEQRMATVAAAYPARYDIQLAAALHHTSAASETIGGLQNAQLRSLLPLRERFGDQPGLYAHLFRYLCLGDFKLSRPEENLVLPPQKDGKSSSVQTEEPPITPEALSLALDSSAAGERLDPQNAVFPLMRSVALMQAHRDTEAVAALKRAGQAPDWNEYLPEEIHAHLAFLHAANGQQGVLSESAVAGAILFPQYVYYRKMARVMTALAVEREQDGDIEGGFAIRQAVARIGDKMRVQSSNLIGSLVGIAIANISAARPGGAPLLTDADYPRSETRAAAQRSQYVAYLNRIGHADEAATFVAEVTAGERARALSQPGLNLSLFSVNSLFRLTTSWGDGVLLLLATLWFLLLGGAAALLCRTPRIRAGQPLHRAIRWGMLISAAAAGEALLYAGGYSDADAHFDLYTGVALFDMLLIGGMFIALRRGETWRGWGRNLGICAATLVGLAAVAGLFLWTARWVPQFVAIPQAFGGVGGDAGPLGYEQMLTELGTAVCIALMVPGALLVLALSGWKKAPASVSLLRGLRRSALGAAAVCLLLYGVTIGFTVRNEARARVDLEALATHEGAYLVKLAGQEWPGPAAGPDAAAATPPNSAPPPAH